MPVATSVSVPSPLTGRSEMSTIKVTGTLPSALTLHAVMTQCHFPTQLPTTPRAAWLADYKGGDCAEAIWIVRNLTSTGFELWGLNCCNRQLNCDFTVNLVIDL